MFADKNWKVDQADSSTGFDELFFPNEDDRIMGYPTRCNGEVLAMAFLPDWHVSQHPDPRVWLRPKLIKQQPRPLLTSLLWQLHLFYASPTVVDRQTC